MQPIEYIPRDFHEYDSDGIHLWAYPEDFVLVQPKPNLVRFSETEWVLIMPILTSYPQYCPYEVLHASFYGRRTDDEAITQSRTLLHKARDAGPEAWDSVMKPLRNALSRARLRIEKHFQLKVTCILDTGYTVVHTSQKSEMCVSKNKEKYVDMCTVS